MLKFAMLCLLKFDNEDESSKSSAREFHSLMDNGIQDFVKYLFDYKVQLYFKYFSKGNQKLH